MQIFATRTISVSIARSWQQVYDFVSDPENMPRWASGLAGSLRQVDGEWVAEAPQGSVKVRFTQRNTLGVLDHHVVPAKGAEIYVPLRVMANGSGSEVVFTLFRRPGVTDEEFASDARWVERDLEALRGLLESD